MSKHTFDSHRSSTRTADAAERLSALLSGISCGLALSVPAVLVTGVAPALAEARLAACAWVMAAGLRLLAVRLTRRARRTRVGPTRERRFRPAGAIAA